MKKKYATSWENDQMHIRNLEQLLINLAAENVLLKAQYAFWKGKADARRGKKH